MTEESLKKLKKIFAIKWVIYFGFVMSVFAYFAVAVVIKKANIKTEVNEDTVFILRNFFVVIAAIVLLISLYLRSILTTPEKFIKMMSKRKINEMVVDRYVKIIDSEEIKKLGRALLFSNTIDLISWALCEVIAVLGLVLFILSGNILYIQAFGATALLALAFERPNFNNFAAIMQAALKGAGEGA